MNAGLSGQKTGNATVSATVSLRMPGEVGGSEDEGVGARTRRIDGAAAISRARAAPGSFVRGSSTRFALGELKENRRWFSEAGYS